MSKKLEEFENLLGAVGVEINGGQPHDILLHDESALDDVLRLGTLGLGESYAQGKWDTDDLPELIARVSAPDSGLQEMVGKSPILVLQGLRQRLFNMQVGEHAVKNITTHYDRDLGLYEAMLDKRMVYTCGYWRGDQERLDMSKGDPSPSEPDTDLDRAQVAKLDLVCRKLNLEPGMKMIDIGCGYGALAVHASERYGVAVLGVTLSEDQIRIAKERTHHLDSVEIRYANYIELDEEVDRIASVGMFEHVGAKNWQDFFDKTKALLKPEGLALHHTIGNKTQSDKTDAFYQKYVFPYGVTPAFSQMQIRSEAAGLNTMDVQNFGTGYYRTLCAWNNNLERAGWYASAAGGYSEFDRRIWKFYLGLSAGAFKSGALDLYQTVYSHPGDEINKSYIAAR